MADRARKNFTLSQETLGLLAHLGNASEYVERIVLERWREWQNALAVCVGHEMTSSELLACCDVLNGHHLLAYTGIDTGNQGIALELHDGQRLNGTAEKWEIDPGRWGALVQRVARTPALAEAISTVATEFWAGNEACETAIRRIGKSVPAGS